MIVKRIEYMVALLVFAVITVVMSWKIALTPTVYGDTPYVTQYSINVILDYTLHLWHLEALGNNYPWPYVHLLNIPLLYLSKFVGINLYYFIRVLVIFISQVCFFIFVSKITKNIIVRIFSSVLYVLNPAFITHFNMGGTLYHWILIPLLLKYVYAMVFDHKEQSKSLITISIILALLFFIFPTFITVVLLLIFPPIIYYVFRRGFRGVANIAFIALTVLIIVSPYLYYMFSSITDPTLKIEASSILSDFRYTYQALSLANFLMMIGNVGSPQVNLGYNSYSINTDMGFLSILLFFIGSLYIINYSGDEYKKLTGKIVLFTALEFVIIAEVIRLLAYSHLSFIIERIFILWTFRNPIKLQLGYAVVFPVIAGLGLEKLLSTFRLNINDFRRFSKEVLITKLSLKNVLGKVFSGLIIISVLAYPIIFNSVALNGDLGLNTVYGNTLGHLYDSDLSSLAVNLTRYKQRGLIIPFDHEVELYIQFHAPLFYISRLGMKPEVANLLNEILSTGDPELLGNLLRLISIKTIYVYKNKSNIYFPILNPQIQLNKLIDTLNKISTPKEIGSFVIYDINNALPEVYLSNDIVYYPNKIGLLSGINNNFYGKRYAFMELKKISTKIINKSIIRTYELRIFFNKNYTFYCYSNKCHFKVLNSNISREFYLENNQSTTAYLKQGVYKLIYKTNANLTDLINRTYLNNNEIVLGNVNGNFSIGARVIILKPGGYSWQSFFILLKSLDNNISYKIIFHIDGIVEIAKITKNGIYIPGVHIWNFGELFLRNKLNISINRFKELLSININGYEHYLVLPDLGKNIEVIMGSDKSITYINTAYALTFGNDFPSFIISTTPNNYNSSLNYTVYRHSPTDITIALKENQEPILIILNENFNKNWKISGAKILGHYRVNMFFNGWLVELSGKNHQIHLSYAKQEYYEILVRISIVAFISCIIYLLFIPEKELMKIIKKNLSISGVNVKQ